MSSDERLEDRGASDAADSLDVASKKKKSFHPIRSLKRFFAHGNTGGSRQRSNNGNDNSVLLKASSTTDVVVAAEVPKEDISGCLQNQSKKISLSADSVFSVEKSFEPSHHAVTSSETLLHSEHLQKWQNLEGSLLSLDSKENEAEEDFFKDKWMVSSKSLMHNRECEGDAAAAETGSVQEEIDLNFVKRDSSLTSSAAVHRLAIRPRGKRVASIHQQKMVFASSDSQPAVASLPLVEEERGTDVKAINEDSIRVSKLPVWLGAMPESKKFAETDKVQGILAADKVQETVDSSLSDGKSVVVKSGGGEETTSSSPKIEAVDSHSKKSGAAILEDKRPGSKTEKAIVVENAKIEVEKDVALKEDALNKPRIVSATNVAADEKPTDADELSIIQPSSTAESHTEKPPANEQEQVLSTAVVKRQKPPQAVVPSAQEIQAMAAKRQTCAFSTEADQSGEKPAPKRSSVILGDLQLPHAEAVGSELALMFSRFQRRSSQKKQNDESESKIADSSNPKPTSELVSSKEQLSSRAAAEVKTLGKVGDENIGRGNETSSGASNELNNVINISADQNTSGQENIVRPLANKNRSIEGAGKTSGSKYLPVIDSTKHTKSGREMEMKATENTENNNISEKKTEKILEQRKQKTVETKNETPDQKQRYSNKQTDLASTTDRSGASDVKEEKAKSLKKSYSVSYRAATTAAASASLTKSAAVVSLGNKARSSSQSEMTEATAEVPTKTSSVQALRRGSLTYTYPKTSAIPISENSKNLSGNAMNNVSDNAAQIKDGCYQSHPISVTTRSSQRSDVLRPIFVRSATVTSNVPLTHGSTPPSGTGTPHGPTSVLSNSKLISLRVTQGIIKPTNVADETPKHSESPQVASIQAIPSSSQSPAEVPSKDTKEISSLTGESSPNKDPVQPAPSKSALLIRPASGTRSPHLKISQAEERTTVVEWMGMARQKTKAWTDGKMDVLEKTSCK